jgi:hypothetical protein
LISASGSPVWCQQSNPPEKDTSGSQAGSSGKSPEQMGSQGSNESPVRKGDNDTEKKSKKDKKAKKTGQAKSNSKS